MFVVYKGIRTCHVSSFNPFQQINNPLSNSKILSNIVKNIKFSLIHPRIEEGKETRDINIRVNTLR